MTDRVKPCAAAAAQEPLGIDLARRQISPTVSADASSKQVAPMRIIVTLTTSGRKWRATLGGRVLCTSAAPLVKSARVLIAEDFGPNLVIEMWRAGTDAWALRGRLGVAAATLLDGETAAPHAKNGVPVRFLGKAASSKGGRA